MDAKKALSSVYRRTALRRHGKLQVKVGLATPLNIPAPPSIPELLEPREVLERKTGSKADRNALLQDAHIDLNAVSFQCNAIARACDTQIPIGYYDYWVKAADEGSKHSNLMSDCPKKPWLFYGSVPAHAGMWRTTENTANGFLKRLAVV